MSSTTSDRSTAFTLNQTNITSQLKCFALIRDERNNPIAESQPWWTEKRNKKLRGAMVKDVHLENIYIEKLIKKQRSFVNSPVIT